MKKQKFFQFNYANNILNEILTWKIETSNSFHWYWIISFYLVIHTSPSPRVVPSYLSSKSIFLWQVQKSFPLQYGLCCIKRFLHSKLEKNKTYFRVFIKEEHKVNTYCTAKKCLFGASMGFILTKTCGHLIIYTKDLKYFTLNVI